jgi:hypothetical protein
MIWTRVIGLAVALAPAAASAQVRVNVDLPPIQVAFGGPPPPAVVVRQGPPANRVWVPARWEIDRGRRVYRPGYWQVAAPAPVYSAPVYSAPVYEPPAYGAVEVEQAPPPPRVEVQTPMPFAGAVWIPGTWEWNGRGYYWTAGTWSAPRPGFRWEAHHWVRHGRHWAFRPGHWHR